MLHNSSLLDSECISDMHLYNKRIIYGYNALVYELTTLILHSCGRIVRDICYFLMHTIRQAISNYITLFGFRTISVAYIVHSYCTIGIRLLLPAFLANKNIFIRKLLSVSCVPNVTSVSGFSILDCLLGFINI